MVEVEVSLIEELLQYFEGRRSFLTNQLRKSKEKQREVERALLKLPFTILFWHSPLQWLKKWWLSRKSRGLNKEISRFKRRIKRFVKAEKELRKGNYDPAISLLDALIDKIPPTFSDTSLNGPGIAEPNPMLNYILELRGELIRLQREETEKGG